MPHNPDDYDDDDPNAPCLDPVSDWSSAKKLRRDKLSDVLKAKAAAAADGSDQSDSETPEQETKMKSHIVSGPGRRMKLIPRE